jgi:hypothetical protein
MVRGHRGGKRRGARKGGTTPPVASTHEGSNPQTDEQVVGQEQIGVGDVVGLMRSFRRMFEALISRWARRRSYDARVQGSFYGVVLVCSAP